MTTLGAIVVASDGAAMASTLDSLARQSLVSDVTIALDEAADERIAGWLAATCAFREWTLCRFAGAGFAVAANAALQHARADWLLVLNAGEVLTPYAAAPLHELLAVGEARGVVAGSVRLVGLRIDQSFSADISDSAAAFDPGHPGLAGLIWARESIERLGGLDGALASEARYDLWLKMVGQGLIGRTLASEIVQVSAERSAPMVVELTSPDYPAAAARIVSRHATLLAAAAGAVLEARARRVSELGRTNLAALERHRAAERELESLGAHDGPPPILESWRASPLSRQWGYERGGPLDRHYIEAFLAGHSEDVQGAVLEVQEDDYTRRFGANRVSRSDVVDLTVANHRATIITDLRCAANIPEGTYDCVILTQTLHVIPQMSEVISECHRILRSGGVLLLTVPAVSRVCLEYGRDGDFWRLTPAGARRLTEPVFGRQVDVTAMGNAATGAAFLMGLGRDEVPEEVRAPVDAYNPALIGVRAAKAGGQRAPSVRTGRQRSGAVLLYHRVGGTDPDPHRINVSIEAFDQQASWLARSCVVVPLDELVVGAARGMLPPRCVAITFDDGYLDTLTTAARMLEGHKLPATCFVMTQDLDEGHRFWWDRLSCALLGTGPRPAVLDIALDGRRQVLPTATDGERLHVHSLVYHAVVGAPASAREGIIATVEAWANAPELGANCRRMTADQIRQLALAGFDIAAHTVTHPMLPSLPAEEQIREMANSREILERIVGRSISTLAYPFGAFDATALSSAARAGFTHAFTCEPRALVSADNPLQLPRLDPQTNRLHRFVATVDAALLAAS